MIGRAYRRAIDVGTDLVQRAGLRPNGVTLLALAIGLVACAVFLWNGNVRLFACLLLAAGFLDHLDGSLARRLRLESRFGGYLDAICDRVNDSAVLLALAWRTSYWALCMLMVIASYSVSYAKARAAVEAPVSNLGWPHLMGREERVIGLSATLLLWGFFPSVRPAGFDLLQWGLGLMTIGMAATAVRRVFYARAILTAVPVDLPR
jgi:phosphatidylglycerophosphate synthase